MYICEDLRAPGKYWPLIGQIFGHVTVILASDWLFSAWVISPVFTSGDRDRSWRSKKHNLCDPYVTSHVTTASPVRTKSPVATCLPRLWSPWPLCHPFQLVKIHKLCDTLSTLTHPSPHPPAPRDNRRVEGSAASPLLSYYCSEKLCKHCTFKFKFFIFQNKLVSKDQSV